jgi:HlyD family secretion protein
LQASLKKSEAQVNQARRAVDEATSNVTQQQTQVLLAKEEFDRAVYLVQKGFQTKEVLDQRQQQLDGANAALEAANFRVIEFQHALDAATHDVELYGVQIADDTLVAPRDGRLQYRIANVGEVLPAGGHVFAMLDTSYVYMDIYLPTLEAGKIKYGADARIVVDAYPHTAIPAKVMFIATQAQFTPKTVETHNERDKLMFRVRVRIVPDWLHGREDAVSSGLPGVAYILTDPAAKWPDALQGSAPQ